MWPALWPLAMADLGKFTKAGSSLLIMAMFGGAVIPTLYGWLKDVASPQQAYWLCLPCFLFILYYGVPGTKSVRNKQIDSSVYRKPLFKRVAFLFVFRKEAVSLP